MAQKSILSIALFCFLTGTQVFSVDSAPKNPDPCAEALARRQEVVSRLQQGNWLLREAPLHHKLSGEVEKDLGIKDLLEPLLAKRLSLPFAQIRLAHLLRHPVLDVNYIRQRYSAIQFLIEHPDLRKKLREYFTDQKNAFKFLGKLWVASEESINTVNDIAEDIQSSYFFNLTKVISVVTWLPLPAALLSRSFSPLLMTAYGYAMAAQGGIPKLIKKRKQFLNTKDIFSGAYEFSPELLNSQNSILENLGQILASPQQGHERADLRALTSSLNSVNNNVGGRILDVTLWSAFTLSRTAKTYANNVEGLSLYFAGLAELEILFMFAELYEEYPGEFTFPELLDPATHPAYLQLENVHHPYFFLMNSKKSAPSSILLSADVQRWPDSAKLAFVVGPNGRGKTGFLSMIPNILNMASIGPIPGQKMIYTPMLISSSIYTSGSLSGAKSNFQSQAARVAQSEQDYAQAQGAPFIQILDEIYTGTSQEEHKSAEHALIEVSLKRNNALTILASHNRVLTELETEYKGFRNFHVSDSDEAGRIYRIESGVSYRRNAFDEMSAAGSSPELVNRARELYEERYGPHVRH